MTFDRILRAGKAGMNTLLSSVTFFYSHLPLVAISLIPSLFRSYQMWSHLDSPVWMEFVVEATRIVLFMMIIAGLSKTIFKALFDKVFWSRLGNICTNEINKNWPHIFIAQLIIFIVILYGLMNLVILLTVNLLLAIMVGQWEIQDHEALHNALLFFIKNMSIIPISMVYILKMCGVRPVENDMSDRPSESAW